MTVKMAKTSFGDIFTKEMVYYYGQKPVDFVTDIIFNVNAKGKKGDLVIAPEQMEPLLSIATDNKVSIKSGRGVGKSAFLSWIIMWFMSTRPFPKVICTAPTFRQLNDVLWPELSKWHRNSLVRDIFTWTNKRFYLTEDPKNWFASAITASKPESMQGLREDHFMVLFDEASGIDDEIYNVMQGSLTRPDNKIVVVGNPTKTSGFFFDSHNRFKCNWKPFTFSSENSPLVKKEWVNEMREKYGENSDIYKVHVKGEFPSGSPESFIPLEALELAKHREVKAEGDIQIGVDVAHFGDDRTAVAWRHGNKVYDVVTKTKLAIPETVGLVLDKIKQIRILTGSTDKIKVLVDSVGVGAGVSDMLTLDREHNIEVIPVNFGSAADDPNMMYSATEMWSTFRDLLPNLELPDNDDLLGELSKRKFTILPSGKVRIQPKSEFKTENGFSPDIADAVILACAKKTNAKILLKDFDFLDKTVVRESFSYCSGEAYCSIWYGNDKRYNVVLADWDGNKLWVKDELISNDSIAAIAGKLSQSGKPSIYGNKTMFGNKTDDLSLQFMKYGIFVQDNYKYDENGCLAIINQLFKDKRIILKSTCFNLIDQLRRWNTHIPRSEYDVQYGLCFSLLNIVSELRDKIEKRVVINPFTPYSEEKYNNIRRIQRPKVIKNNTWMLN